jgi:hypothetical protein
MPSQACVTIGCRGGAGAGVADVEVDVMSSAGGAGAVSGTGGHTGDGDGDVPACEGEEVGAGCPVAEGEATTGSLVDEAGAASSRTRGAWGARGRSRRGDHLDGRGVGAHRCCWGRRSALFLQLSKMENRLIENNVTGDQYAP